MSRQETAKGGEATVGKSWGRHLQSVYLEADPRWLGVLRIVLGVLLCGELLRKWAAARDFYTNDGVLSNHFSLFRPLGQNVFSLYHAFSTPAQVSVAFAFTLAIFVAFLVGYRTRLFHVLAFVCITSLDARNLMVENGGTVALNLLCFWTLFLPMGERFSVDAVRKSLQAERDTTDVALNAPLARVTNPVRSLACLALLVQWSVVYFFNTVHKSGKGWVDGSAIHWFLHQDRIITWFGIWARENVPFGVLQGLTYSTLVVEGALSFLLLSPFKPQACRVVAACLAVGLHGSIAALARLGVFSYVMMAYFVWPHSASLWSWLKSKLVPTSPGLRVIYDDDCGICLMVCRLLRRLTPDGTFDFVGSSRCHGDESHADYVPIPGEIEPAVLERSVVVVEASGEVSIEDAAIRRIANALPLRAGGLGLLLAAPGVRQLVRRGYRAFAARRAEVSHGLGLGYCGLGGEQATPLLRSTASDSGSDARRRLREALVLVAMVVATIQLCTDNAWARSRLRSIGVSPHQPAVGRALVETFRLYQGWRMFAPEPPYEDGKLVVDARTKDGRIIDPLTGRAPEFNPYTDRGWGHDQFWCDVHLKMFFSQYAPYRSEFKKYLQKYHERTGNPGDRLVAFDVWWVNDKSPPPGALEGEPQPPVKIVSHGRVRDSLAKPWLEKPDPRKKQPE